MTLAPLAAEAQAAGLPPLLLPPELRLTPDQFALVCAANPEAVLELSADGQLITKTPTGGNTGFRLADGSVRSPDASAMRLERWQALTPEQRRGFPPLCPDLVVELVSPSDEGPRGAEALGRKMAAYIANGAQLGWLLFPEQGAAEIWRATTDPRTPVVPERLEPTLVLEGGSELPGLRLELAEIWAG